MSNDKQANKPVNEGDKLDLFRRDAHSALNTAERAWYTYAGLIDVGPERTEAFMIYEAIRRARFRG